ncbi:MAG: TIGR01777 family oxidoreductase [Desulfobacterium sp.]|nr:TIGR01777 family oxidoreductase [Desulfobacterium sp.]
MKVVITGGSGFVGSFLARHFLARGDRVTGVGRSLEHRLNGQEGFTWISADTTRGGAWQESVARADLVVNLAGKNILSPWTQAVKAEIYNSRILTTENVVAALVSGKGTRLFSASALGVYGDRGEEILTENSPSGDDFLAGVCVDWEARASAAVEKGSRVVIMRFGVVLGRQGGALGKMVPMFKAYMGGPLGDGNHWLPWIHIADLAGAVDFFLEEEGIHGPVNFCSPGSIRQGEFASALGRVLHRPAVMPAPAWVVRMMMGEMGRALMASTKGIPEGLETAGFEFRFPTIQGALGDLFA